MSETTTERKEVPFTIDGVTYNAYQGETVLEAALRNGYFIPHYCWHPSLSIAGNCRMCLVHTKPGPPKPQIACNTVVSEGMEVDGSSEKTKTAREGILEFLLANHPLDCPICDQAGECDLQQYSFDHGRSSSKFAEIKTQRPRHDLGPRIRFNGNRCIVCTRCVRFCHEVTGTGELAVMNRSDASWIDVFPGVPLDNPLSGCVADLCPVGALLDTDWIHTTRTWLLRGTKSVCSGCATGCNVNLETFDDTVKRITPRENQAVNNWWMCDKGRDKYKEAKAETRLRVSRKDGEPVTHQEALEAALELYRSTPNGKVAFLTTGHATLEELHLLDTITGGPGGVAYQPEGESFTALDGFEVSADKNPNRAGVVALLGDVDSGELVQKGIESGQVELVVICDSSPGGGALVRGPERGPPRRRQGDRDQPRGLLAGPEQAGRLPRPARGREGRLLRQRQGARAAPARGRLASRRHPRRAGGPPGARACGRSLPPRRLGGRRVPAPGCSQPGQLRGNHLSRTGHGRPPPRGRCRSNSC